MYTVTLVHSCLCGYHNNKQFTRENRLLFTGAFHYAKDSGNFGRNSKGKDRFGFF